MKDTFMYLLYIWLSLSYYDLSSFKFSHGNRVRHTFYFLEWALNPMRKIVDCIYDILASIAELGKSCKASHYCTAESSQLDNVNNFFTHWVVCIVPSIATKASQ